MIKKVSNILDENIIWIKTNKLISRAVIHTEMFYRGGERTQVLSISFIFSFSPLYRWATAAPQ
jgi:hypothetical protein